MATSTATLTLTFIGATQNLADNKRDLALLDYAKALGLAIFQADGVTVDNSLVGPAVRLYIATQLRDTVIGYRGNVSANSTRTTELGNLGSL